MTRTITIDPVTRIEGHAKVLLNVAEDGSLKSAGMVVKELRGFERILVGMEATRMPLVTGRICGVCPSAHHLAAVKAIDAAAGVNPPPAAKMLRELLYMGHFIHSHTLSIFVLQGPDLVMGLDADPAVRNVVGVVQAVPEIAKKALRLRTVGQLINENVGGRGIHPVTAVVGGMAFQCDESRRKKLERWVDESLELVTELAGVAKDLLLKFVEKHPDLLHKMELPTWYMGTVNDGKVNFYDGPIRIVDSNAKIRAEFPTKDYREHLVESTLKWSYMKPVHIKSNDTLYLYRVNTLGRLNMADGMATPIAQQELEAFRAAFGHPCHATIMHVYARVIELVYACERAKQLVSDPAILGESRVPAQFKGARGVGHVEAPRGTLIHDYLVDEDGVVREANLIVATQQNYDAINRTIQQAAESYVLGKGDDALLNAVEFAIRCYDPCLSCATHAVGQMPLDIVVQQGDEVIRRVRRGV